MERDGLTVESTAGGVLLQGRVDGNSLFLSVDDVRWLVLAAFPAALASLGGQEQVSDAIRQGYAKVREG